MDVGDNHPPYIAVGGFPIHLWINWLWVRPPSGTLYLGLTARLAPLFGVLALLSVGVLIVMCSCVQFDWDRGDPIIQPVSGFTLDVLC
jgi:hypothetical protein